MLAEEKTPLAEERILAQQVRGVGIQSVQPRDGIREKRSCVFVREHTRMARVFRRCRRCLDLRALPLRPLHPHRVAAAGGGRTAHLSEGRTSATLSVLPYGTQGGGASASSSSPRFEWASADQNA